MYTERMPFENVNADSVGLKQCVDAEILQGNTSTQQFSRGGQDPLS